MSTELFLAGAVLIIAAVLIVLYLIDRRAFNERVVNIVGNVFGVRPTLPSDQWAEAHRALTAAAAPATPAAAAPATPAAAAGGYFTGGSVGIVITPEAAAYGDELDNWAASRPSRP
ncbi:MAG: hypothetical protein LBG75_01220 [Candidatus Nomurabacteria bacterium]|jgi:hypothetical protein|nr:hypothetical protein [Candidatus Nomurabacteria bacterium]